MHWRRARVWLGLLLVSGSALFAARGLRAELATPRSLAATEYIGSDACTRCHPAHAESFRRTFHRTMTQEASDSSVLADFQGGATLDYGGVRAHMTRGRAGEFLMTFSAAGGTQRWQAQVERSVGSHRYQQYLARDRDVFFRLPVAWDVAERRFIHMNGAFLTPDPDAPAAGSSISRTDYDRHVTRWNDNCVFCHNVHPNPGLGADGEFRTRVAELGIACEACHGPAAEHAALNHNPLRRYALHTGAAADPTIRNPARMSPARSAEVCGRCHGQRITADVGRFLRDGDPFVPGDPLAQQSTPLFRDTTLRGEPGHFAARFWRDGTARLTAYEYQGYLQSPCARGGKLSCESCHAMHRGDPSGQIRPDRTGDAACTSCHAELAGTAAQAAHSHHDAAGAGARCVNCHMPDVVYGLVSVRLSHRIEVPNPVAQARAARPDACTLCHLDRDRHWAAAMSEHLFGQSGAASLAPDPLPAVTRQLLAGDPIERAVAAHALGQGRAHAAAEHAPQALGLLADVMIADAYPAVRSIAQRALRQRVAATRPELLPLLAAYGATDAQDSRSAIVSDLLQALGPAADAYPDAAMRAQLRAASAATAIEIGE